MTSRDLVRRSLERRAPASIPRQVTIRTWAEAQHPQEVARLRAEFPEDITVAPRLLRRTVLAQPGTDEWGCRFHTLEGTLTGLVQEPLIRTRDDVERFRPPAHLLDVDRDAVNAFCRSTDRFVLAGALIRPFERLCLLRTMEGALADVAVKPPAFTELLRRVHEHYLAEVEAWATTEVDAVVLMDDWGGEDRMLIAPALWRTLFKPLYRDYCDVARRFGKFVFMHSDGNILDIIPDLIEVGVHALNLQIDCIGVEELGRRFRGKVTFWGDSDWQRRLASASFDDIRRTVIEQWEQLDANGGLIAHCEFGPGARPENVFEVLRAWNEVGAR